VTGYDDAGDTLIGWSMFQDHADPSHNLAPGDSEAWNPPSGFESNGYFRRTDWFARTRGLVALELGAEPDQDELYLAVLHRVPAILRGPSVCEYHTGAAAFDAYIAALENDDDWPADDPPALALRKMVHYDAMTMIAERVEGAGFLRDVARSTRFAAAREPLEAAVAAFEVASSQMEGWWGIVGPIWDDEAAQVRACADPEVRRRFLPNVRLARQKDVEAADRLDDALRYMT
jgi:hypothetical protein